MTDWRATSLGEICKFQAGDAFPKELQGAATGDVPIVKVSDMNLSGNELFISYANNWLSRSAVARDFKLHPAGAVIFAKIGVALTSNRRRILIRPTVIDNNMMSAVCTSGIDPRWFYYLLTTLDFNEVASGSALPYLTVRDLNRIAVSLPSLPEQRAIAATLGALDDKIELNRKMNVTLEAMARALFRDWFVDFGPTCAKMEARAPYLSPTLWSLFPDRLDDEGKPEGWEVSNLASILSVLETGRRPKGGVAGISGGVPSVGAESIDGVGKFDFLKTKFVSEEFFRKMAKGHVSAGDVLIYKDGGKPGELRPSVSYVSNGFPFDRFCINEHVFRARSNRVDQAFLYCLLSTDEAFAQMRELATGVAQPGLNQAQMGRLSFILPTEKVLLEHSASILKTLINACNVNASESRTLAQTRDLLLPRLMSGELRVAEAERIVGEVA